MEPPTACAVGALVCDVAHLGAVFAALQSSDSDERGEPLARRKAVTDYAARDDGALRKAVHLTVGGAALLVAGHAPPAVRRLLDNGVAAFVPGLRLGRQRVRPVASSVLAAFARPPAARARFAYVELFAGIGGFRVALDALGGRCALASEIDAECQASYAANFGADELVGDVTALADADFPAHELLTAGFPCQPHARRGSRRALADARGMVFFEIVRCLRAVRPAAFLLENVWALLFAGAGGAFDPAAFWDTSKWVFGADFALMKRALELAGYVVDVKVLCASGWLPQKRERAYLVGFRNDLAPAAAARFAWPSPPFAPRGGALADASATSLERRPIVRDVLEPPGAATAACELSSAQWDAVRRSATWRSGGEALRFASRDGVARTLTSSYKSSFASTSELVGPEAHGGDAIGGGSEGGDDGSGASGRPRFYTPRECARLMGFPDAHALGCTRAPGRAYRQLGNAVAPPPVRDIARALLVSLGIVPREDALR